MKNYLLISVIFASLVGQAQSKPNLKKEFDTLGDNKEVVERVQKMDSRQKIRVVQNRLVDRNNRLELAVNYAYVGNGDSYIQTQNTGGMLEFHINPRWSFGVQYQKSYNSLTPEGRTRYELAENGQSDSFPSIDFPLNTTLATISFYPIYGKLNLFDSGIAQFDIYTLLGYGKMKLNSGESDTFAGGLGAGIWFNPRITTRLEFRYQQYKDLLQTERRTQNTMQALASVGVLIW